MKTCGMVVSSMLAIFLVLHLGLIPIMGEKNELQIGVAGQLVVLNCKGVPRDTKVTWRYYKSVIRMYTTTSLKGKATMTDRSEIIPNSKDLKVSDLKLSDAGIYTCEYGSQTVSISLHVFELTISSGGHFLPNEVPQLTIMQNSSHPLPNLDFALFNSNSSTVRPKLLQNNTREKYILVLKKLEATDSGTWMCRVQSVSPSINHNIAFDVKVLGFQNPDSERKYATVNSTVVLSWHLNFRKIIWKEGFTGQLKWTQQENAIPHELLDFNVTARGEMHETQKSSHFRFEIPERKSESNIEVKLPKIRFDHSGQYQCQLAYNRRHTESMIELVVMKVSANPAGPLPRGAKMTLICQVSSQLPPNAHLHWERVNGTQADVRKSKQNEAKVEVNVSAAGLWNCRLIEDDEVKISLNYLVEEAPVWMSYVVIGTSIAGSVLVFGLACLCIVSGINWQQRRKRAKRMIQARQHLLENKTCQCQQRDAYEGEGRPGPGSSSPCGRALAKTTSGSRPHPDTGGPVTPRPPGPPGGAGAGAGAAAPAPVRPSRPLAARPGGAPAAVSPPALPAPRPSPSPRLADGRSAGPGPAACGVRCGGRGRGPAEPGRGAHSRAGRPSPWQRLLRREGGAAAAGHSRAPGRPAGSAAPAPAQPDPAPAAPRRSAAARRGSEAARSPAAVPGLAVGGQREGAAGAAPQLGLGPAASPRHPGFLPASLQLFWVIFPADPPALAFP
ncbi:T-cell surface glycoprotein CD4 [Numenius arquata]|uniref:T-cell surface glycoprotein CD4 n=1 Tax=Numenius arquata TaxID=31919 RepID=UPI003D303E57